jgi:hypothetical protein
MFSSSCSFMPCTCAKRSLRGRLCLGPALVLRALDADPSGCVPLLVVRQFMRTVDARLCVAVPCLGVAFEGFACATGLCDAPRDVSA